MDNMEIIIALTCKVARKVSWLENAEDGILNTEALTNGKHQHLWQEISII